MTNPEANVSNKTVVDLSKLAVQITEEIAYYTSLDKEAKDRKHQPFTIQKIKPNIKSIEKNMYEPTKLSLGPYHHGIEAFKTTEANKLKCFDHIAMSKQDKDVKFSREKALEKYLAVMDQCVNQKAMDVYTENLTTAAKSFSQIMLLDGCFIIAQVLGFEETEQNSLPLFLKSWCNPYVARDMLLLENQIPFFAIEKIYELILGDDTSSAFRERVLNFMQHCMMHSYLKNVPETRKVTDFHHLLHLYLMCLQPAQDHNKMYLGKKVTRHNPSHNNHGDFLHPTRWRRATMYDNVGIKLKKKEFDENNPHSLLDITFQNNVIEIPDLQIDSSTRSLFKNLIALEKSNPKYGNQFTTYVIFLTQIMSELSDITFLVKNDIISHSLVSNEKVFDLFSSLKGDVMFDLSENYYLKEMNKVLEESYQKGLKRWVVHTSFNRGPSPKYRFFMVLGFMYVFFELIRTYFGAKNYYKLITLTTKY